MNLIYPCNVKNNLGTLIGSYTSKQQSVHIFTFSFFEHILHIHICPHGANNISLLLISQNKHTFDVNLILKTPSNTLLIAYKITILSTTSGTLNLSCLSSRVQLFNIDLCFLVSCFLLHLHTQQL